MSCQQRNEKSECLPVKECYDQDQGTEEHQLQVPPVADKVGDTRHDHESQREERVAEDGAQGELGGVTPLTTCWWTHCEWIVVQTFQSQTLQSHRGFYTQR